MNIERPCWHTKPKIFIHFLTNARCRLQTLGPTCFSRAHGLEKPRYPHKGRGVSPTSRAALPSLGPQATLTLHMPALPLCRLLWNQRLTMLRSLPWPHILQLPPQLVCSPLWPDFVEAVPLPILCCGTRVPGRPPGPPPAARVLAPLQWHNVSNILYTLHSHNVVVRQIYLHYKTKGAGTGL